MGRVLMGMAVLAAIALAATPVGSLSSSGSVVLSGSSIPETAASSLPVVAGDLIRTSSSSATIVFADKSQLVIAPDSQVALVTQGSNLQVQVISGSAMLNNTKKSTIELIQPRPPQVSLLTAAAENDKNPKPKPRSKVCPPGHTPTYPEREDGNCGFGNDK